MSLLEVKGGYFPKRRQLGSGRSGLDQCSLRACHQQAARLRYCDKALLARRRMRCFRVTSYGCPSQLAEACAFLRVDICRTRDTVALCAQRSDGQDMLSLQFRMLSFSCVRCAAGAAAGDGFAVAASLAWACPRLRLASFPYSRSWDLLDQGLIKVRCTQVCVWSPGAT